MFTIKEYCIILLLISVQKIGADWVTPYFLPTETVGVTFQSAAGLQQINVREELAWPFQLAIINYAGVGTPTLGTFDIGDNSMLGVTITRNESVWLISIGKRQDYENAQQRIYAFQIYIRNDTELGFVEQGILLTLKNVFDNSPTITYSPTPCRVEELSSKFLTNCTFSVYDPDGMDRNNISLVVNGANNEADLFHFRDFGAITTFEKQFKLFIDQELHYEDRAIYNLDVRVYDANNNTGFIYAILEVIDLPDRDPVWVRPLTTATFDEKQEQYFTLKAIDGDTGINKPICYSLEFEEDYAQYISINATTGVLHVAPIDRDALNQQIFSFSTCAYKCDNTSWIIKNTTILIVQDINDHIPEITLLPETVRILEAKYLTLPLEKFLIEDMDLGNNATYTVNFHNYPSSIAYSEALTLVPTNGYQSTNFSLSVSHMESLDYENEDWRQFDITIVAQEVENVAHISNRSLRIELINWNDEWPIFEAENYEISVMENVAKDFFLQRVLAADRDVGDKVTHSIVGKVAGFNINPESGVIVTADDNVFDYERQTSLLLQIQARDNLITSHSDVLHSSYAQLLINVIDVNDETPELRLPRTIVNITENAATLTELTNKIEARDADGSANLTLEILWSDSYATKSGQQAAREHFEGCFIIAPKYENNNLIYGLLLTNPGFEQQLDYEKYDTIFLYIKVTDLNQEINADSVTAVLTVRVDDVNDNAPQFVRGTLEEPRRVTEMEVASTVLGTIEAFDIDGAGNNVISFTLRPADNITAAGLVTINNTTGVLRVSGDIQCDVPKIYYLAYEVILTDTVHSTVGELNISIVDVNNCVPVIEQFAQQVTLWENATSGEVVGQILAHDADRDAPHNVLEYAINSVIGDAHNLFQVNLTTGWITVHLRNGLTLDRDNDVSYHYIPVLIKDNFNYNKPEYGPVNQRTTFLNVTLLDVNDNAPIMPEAALFSPEFSEADIEGIQSKVELVALDKDEPNTPNSRVSYKILSIEPARDNAALVANYSKIFTIVTTSRNRGRLQTTQPLKGYYGWWRVQVEAYDHGAPVMRNASAYEVYVRAHNFHAPLILYPLPQHSIRVCYALQEPNRPLYQADCVSRLPLFTALDADGGEYGDVTFQLGSETGADKHFKLVKEQRNQTSLYLKKTVVPAGIYYLNVRATDGGGLSSEEIRNLKIVFVDMLGNPMFLQPSYETNFTENEQGLVEERYLPAAYDPKNEGLNQEDELYKIYYFIDDTTDPAQAQLFQLHSETGLLKLNTTLDRELEDTHRLRVRATNNEQGLITNPNSVNFTLDVVIKVNDVNDNAPKFTKSFFAAGITIKDTIGKEILVFHAEDPDLFDPTSYEIDYMSMSTQGENIEAHKMELFSLQRETGVLSLSSYVTNNMRGYFMFDIVALDTAKPPHVDQVAVKIYIVAETNRVKFVFLSDMQTIRRNAEFLKATFQEIYAYDICNIDAIDDVTNQQSSRQILENPLEAPTGVTAFITDVIVHFIHNNEAVAASDIQRRAGDLVFVSQLQNALQRNNLILNDVPHLSNEELTPIVADWLLSALIALIVLLGACCTTLVVMLKMRALKRQLKAFEPAQFGSVASNLNRIAPPTTNIFSVEGSNPIINKQHQTLQQQQHQQKQRSMYEQETSSDSEDDDFGDLQNDPTFEMNNMKNFEQKPANNFEHKILNNDFFRPEKSFKKINYNNDLKTSAEEDKQRF